ncbi:MAG: ChbG/HpnK family deacetylase [Candidatus Omnitrophota bacterium]
MKKLIINADDFGVSSKVNKAIEECWQSGVITGASVMASGAAFQEAADMLKKLGKFEVGAHLTLTGGFVPTREAGLINSLIQRNGGFRNSYKDFGLAYLLKRVDLNQISVEFTGQIEKIKKQGLTITHLDSHEHIHMFPGILRVTASLAKQFNIPYIRMAFEPFSVVRKECSIRDLARHTALKMFIPKAKKIISGEESIKHNDYFWGHFHAERLNTNILSFIIKNLGEGVNELAVHPRESSGELDSLLNGGWRALAELKDVQLITHSIL